MTESPAVAALHAALRSAAPELVLLSPRDRALLLRDLVIAVVDELRRSGRTSERVVFLIKLVALEAGMDEHRDSAAFEQITAWCVQRYYAY